MTEKPMLFSGRLVRAILEGRKTQTRRPMNPQPHRSREYWEWEWISSKCKSSVSLRDARCLGPFGSPGDRLWVKEKHYACELLNMGVGNPFLVYDDEFRQGMPEPMEFRPWRHDLTPKVKFGCRPSIHMPRWASRIDLGITGIRVERLKDITPQDAIAEGVDPDCQCLHTETYGCTDCHNTGFSENPCFAFSHSWDSIYAKQSLGWDDNPWVWVVDFSRIEKGIVS